MSKDTIFRMPRLRVLQRENEDLKAQLAEQRRVIEKLMELAGIACCTSKHTVADCAKNPDRHCPSCDAYREAKKVAEEKSK